MIWLFIVVIIILIFWYENSNKHEEKFSNPPSIADIDFMKNYIKVSKYTLDQSAKKVSNDPNARFTSANILLNGIDSVMTQITELKNGTENTTASNNSISYVDQLIKDLNTYNNVLGLSQNVINHYNSFNEYISNNNNGLNYNQKLYLVSDILSSIRNDLLKYVINKSIDSSNKLTESLNSFASTAIVTDADKVVDFSIGMPTETITPITITDVTPTIVKNPTNTYTNIFPYGTGMVANDNTFGNIDLGTWTGTLDQCKVMCSNDTNCNGFARDYTVSNNTIGNCFAKRNLIYDSGADNGKIKINRDYTDATTKFNQWIKNPSNTSVFTVKGVGIDKNIDRYINIYPYGYGLTVGDTDYNNIDLQTINNITLDQCKVACNANSNCNGFARSKSLAYNEPGDCYLKTNIKNTDNSYKNANRKYNITNTDPGYDNWLKSSEGELSITYSGDGQTKFTY